MPLYRMTKPTAADPEDRPFTEAPFEAPCMADALEYSARRVMLAPDHFGGHPGEFTLVIVEDLQTRRTVSECVHFLPEDVILIGDPHL